MIQLCKTKPQCHWLKTQKEVKSMTAKLYKKGAAFKSLGKKVVKSKVATTKWLQ